MALPLDNIATLEERGVCGRKVQTQTTTADDSHQGGNEMRGNTSLPTSVQVIQPKPVKTCAHFGCDAPAEHHIFGPVDVCMVHFLRMKVAENG